MEKVDETFETSLRGVETRMSEKIRTTMYAAMRSDNESTNRYYAVQRISEQYILQEDKEIKNYTPPVTVYVGEIVCHTAFLKPVPNAHYWLTPMNKGDGDITVRLK